ncbi:hypothetical protein Aperf_G00000015183 [Anoplocephala perfoliata]
MLRSLPRFRWQPVLKRLVRTSFTSDPLTEPKGQFYYVIPEIPTDDPQSNLLLHQESLPRLGDITVEKIFTGISKLIIEYQVALSQLAEAINSNSVPITYENIVTKIDEIIFPVHNTINIIDCLSSTRNDPAWRIVISRLVTKILQTQSEHLYSNADIYCALHKILVQLDPAEKLKRGIIEQLLAECWSNGASLAAVCSGKADSCKSCDASHFPHRGGKDACQKDLNLLFYFRSELIKAEVIFEHMVVRSAFVSSPESRSQASITGRYDSATKIDAQMPSYLSNVFSAKSPGYIPVAESDLSASAPSWFPHALGGKEEGGYIKGMRVNLGMDRAAQLFLCHCSNRELRRVVWQAIVQRASQRVFGGSSGQHASNDNRIDHIRRLRSKVATTMGAPDWISLMWRRSAGRGPTSPDALVDDFLEPIRKRLLPLGEIEWRVLNEWSGPHLRIPPTLEQYDIPYAIEQYNFNMSLAPGHSLSTDPRYVRFLPLENTIESIFQRLGELFGLTLSRLPPNKGHAAQLDIDGSLIYEVVDNFEDKGFKLGEVLVDLNPKHRFGAASFDNVTPMPLVTRFPVPSKSPSAMAADGSIACIFSNLPVDALRVGLTEMEALDIASAFGRCLQHVVSRTPSYAFAGLSIPMPGVSFAGSTGGMPIRDNAFLTQDIIKLLLFRSASMRRAVFGDAPTEAKTYPDVYNPVRGISRMMVLPFLRALYESRFDLDLWGGGKLTWKSWHQISEQHWAKHLPYAHHPDDQWPCSSMGIFGSRGVPGLRYSEIWRQIIARDCLSAFKEAGFDAKWDSDQVKDLFLRYRKTVLDPGTALSCRSVFQAFRGRDPLPDAFLEAFNASTQLSQGFADSSSLE